VKLRARVNGTPFDADVPATASLLEVLRGAGLTGTKEGCRIGVCGLCTVLVGDVPVSSCLYLAGCADEADVWTVEGIAERAPWVVDAFVEREGMQCGICTPGQVVTVASMGPEVCDEPAVCRYLSGNLCRCTGYGTIVEAALAAQLRRDGTDAAQLRRDGTDAPR
jgi:aerobic-type carbon monoxide dehydrogenase small subunit (CoxS/CutS family)